MLLKAGTYRFNDDLTTGEFEQDINFTMSLTSDGNYLEYYFSKMSGGVAYSNFVVVFAVYKIVGNVDGDEIFEEFEEPVPKVYYNADGWVESNPPTPLTYTITEDTEVDDTFGTWYIDNTNYNEVNSTSVLGLRKFNETVESNGNDYGVSELLQNTELREQIWNSSFIEIVPIPKEIDGESVILEGFTVFFTSSNSAHPDMPCTLCKIKYTEQSILMPVHFINLFDDDFIPSLLGGFNVIATANEIVDEWLLVNTKAVEITKKFTRLYLGEVAYSSNGKRFRKLQTEEPTVRLLSATLPAALGAMGSGTVGEDVYLFGGLNDKYNIVNTIYKYNTKTNSLTTPSATLPYTLYGVACGVVGANIYLFGGNTNNDGKKIHKYDTTTNTITTLSAKMPKGLPYMACGVVGTNVYLFGGRGDDDVNTIYKFDTTTDTLTQLSTTLPDVMGGSGCGVVGANIYLFGGHNDFGAKNTIYKFDTTTDTLTTLNATLPNNYGSMKCGVIDTDVYLIGGTVWGNDVNTIYKYDTIADTLEELTTTLPVALSSMACGVVETGIYLFGGNGDNGCVNTIYKYKPE